MLWHQRLGHPSSKIPSYVFRQSSMTYSSNYGMCSSCYLGKSTIMLFSALTTLYTASLQLGKVDFWSPAPVSSNGKMCCMSIVYVCTQYAWIYFLQRKSDVVKHFIEFRKQTEKQLSLVLKSVQFNAGSEFKALAHYFAQHGVEHRITYPQALNKMEYLRESIIILLKWF